MKSWADEAESGKRKLAEWERQQRAIVDLIKALEAVMAGFPSDQRARAIAHLAGRWIFEESLQIEVIDRRYDYFMDRLHMAGASRMLAEVGRSKHGPDRT